MVFVFRRRLIPNQASIPPNVALKKTTYTHDDIIVFPDSDASHD
jgi:hypothetical protein